MKKVLIICFILIVVKAIQAQPYTIGNKYFGSNNYIEYNPGSLPIIISAPHGGRLSPNAIPSRTASGCANDPNFTTAFDTNTQELVRFIDIALSNLLGCKPFTVLCLLDRSKVDCNRTLSYGACGNADAQKSWTDFHNYIYDAKQQILAKYGRGLFIDIHGHGHAIQRNEIGYTLSASTLRLSDASLNANSVVNNSSIRNLTNNNLTNKTHAQLIRGSNAFGTLFTTSGFPSVPSLQDPFPQINDEYFDGGYNTQRWASSDSGTIDGFQIETNFTGLRDNTTNMRKFADSIAKVIKIYLETNAILPNNLATCPVAENTITLSNTPLSNNNLLVGRFFTAPTAPQKITLLEINSNTANQTTSIQTIQLPFTDNTNTLTLGNGLTDGTLTLSGNNKFVTIAGYNVEENSAANILDHTTTRIVGRVDASTKYNTYKLPNSSANFGSVDPFNTTNIRSAFTPDGVKFFVAGGSTTTGSLGGVWLYNRLVPIDATQIFNISNTRFAVVQNNQLYTLNQAHNTDTCRLVQIGNNTPTSPVTSADTTRLLQPIANAVTNVFFTDNGQYCYIASNSTSGQIQKYKLINNSWAFLYSITGLAGSAPRAFTAKNSSTISTDLYIVYANTVYKVVDTLERNTTPTNTQLLYTDNTVGANLRGISFVPESLSLLPVTFNAIQASYNNGISIISWSIINQIQVEKYTVEHSTNGTQFNTIGSIITQTNNKPLDFIFNHLQPKTGVNYYRIVVHNADGSVQYSKTVSIHTNVINEAITFINPSKQGVKIICKLPFSGILSIADNTGKTIATATLNNIVGAYNLPLPISFKGIAIATLSNNTMVLSKKIIVQ